MREAILASTVFRALAEGESEGELFAHYEVRLMAGMQRHLALRAQYYRSGGAGRGGRRSINCWRKGCADPGDLMSRLNSDVSEVQRVSADTLLSVLSNVFIFIGCFLVSVMLVPVCLLTFLHYRRKVTALTKMLRERSADLGSLFVDTIFKHARGGVFGGGRA